VTTDELARAAQPIDDIRRDLPRLIASVMLITKFTPYLMLITETRFFARQVSDITFFA
jgi:hypothetical protein